MMLLQFHTMGVEKRKLENYNSFFKYIKTDINFKILNLI